MTVSIAIPPKVEARLQHLAKQAGKDIAAFVSELIENVAVAPSEKVVTSSSDFDNVIDELFAADSRKLPSMPLSYSRDDIYLDRN